MIDESTNALKAIVFLLFSGFLLGLSGAIINYRLGLVQEDISTIFYTAAIVSVTIAVFLIFGLISHMDDQS